MLCPFDDDTVTHQLFMSPIHRKADHSKSEARICGAVIDVDEETGRARAIERINLSHEP